MPQPFWSRDQRHWQIRRRALSCSVTITWCRGVSTSSNEAGLETLKPIHFKVDQTALSSFSEPNFFLVHIEGCSLLYVCFILLGRLFFLLAVLLFKRALCRASDIERVEGSTLGLLPLFISLREQRRTSRPAKRSGIDDDHDTTRASWWIGRKKKGLLLFRRVFLHGGASFAAASQASWWVVNHGAAGEISNV